MLKGTATNGNYTAKARMKDPNINFTLDGKADMNKKYPSVHATLLIDSINLKNLNFTKGRHACPWQNGGRRAYCRS